MTIDWGQKKVLQKWGHTDLGSYLYRPAKDAAGKRIFQGCYWCRDNLAGLAPDYEFNFPSGDLVMDLTGLHIGHFYGPVGYYGHPDYNPYAPWLVYSWKRQDWPCSPIVTLTRRSAVGEPNRWQFDWSDGDSDLRVLLTGTDRFGAVALNCWGVWVYLGYAGVAGCAWGGLKGGNTPIGTYRLACSDSGTPIGPSARVSANIWSYQFVPAGFWSGLTVGPQRVPCGCNNIESMLEYEVTAA